jgi:hypothetical protein
MDLSYLNWAFNELIDNIFDANADRNHCRYLISHSISYARWKGVGINEWLDRLNTHLKVKGYQIELGFIELVREHEMTGQTGARLWWHNITLIVMRAGGGCAPIETIGVEVLGPQSLV